MSFTKSHDNRTKGAELPEQASRLRLRVTSKHVLLLTRSL